MLRKVLPALRWSSTKGQMGRLCVIGGTEKYTGAPYFVSKAAMQLGIDLLTVVCTPVARVPIKSYSPDLMVTSVLPDDTVLSEGKQTPDCSDAAKLTLRNVDRNHVCSMGSGLGLHPGVQAVSWAVVKHAICRMRRWRAHHNSLLTPTDPSTLGDTGASTSTVETGAPRSLGMVLDADAMWTLCEHADGFRQLLCESDGDASTNHNKTRTKGAKDRPDAYGDTLPLILTPNAREFDRLYRAVMGPRGRSNDELAKAFAVEESDPVVTDPDSFRLTNLGAKGVCLVQYKDQEQSVEDLKAPSSLQMYTADSHPHLAPVAELSRALGGVTIIRKGAVDIISNGQHGMVCSVVGSRRRCGGLGDVLAGTCATMLHNVIAGIAEDSEKFQLNGSTISQRSDETKSSDETISPTQLHSNGCYSSTVDGSDSEGSSLSYARLPLSSRLLVAAHMACSVVRAASHVSFARYGRTLTAEKVLDDGYQWVADQLLREYYPDMARWGASKL